MHRDNQNAIAWAMHTDFGGEDGGRGLLWSRLTDICTLLHSIQYVKKHLKSWMA